MYRRDFLKLCGLFSTALFVQFNPLGRVTSLPAEVEAQGKIFRGTSDGKIHISENAGHTWRLHTDFGSQYSITHLSMDAYEQVIALVDYLGDTFELALSNSGKAWKTI